MAMDLIQQAVEQTNAPAGKQQQVVAWFEQLAQNLIEDAQHDLASWLTDELDEYVAEWVSHEHLESRSDADTAAQMVLNAKQDLVGALVDDVPELVLRGMLHKSRLLHLTQVFHKELVRAGEYLDSFIGPETMGYEEYEEVNHTDYDFVDQHGDPIYIPQYDLWFSDEDSQALVDELLAIVRPQIKQIRTSVLEASEYVLDEMED